VTSGTFPYPGTPTTADGSAVVVWVEQNISEGACAYPITPSTNMGSGYQLAVANGGKNLWNRDGKPSPELHKAQADRLGNWRLLQELAGLR
jgi:hypothetical protein